MGYSCRTSTLDGVGNVKSYLDRNGRTTSYEYNKLGREIRCRESLIDGRWSISTTMTPDTLDFAPGPDIHQREMGHACEWETSKIMSDGKLITRPMDLTVVLGTFEPFARLTAAPARLVRSMNVGCDSESKH